MLTMVRAKDFANSPTNLRTFIVHEDTYICTIESDRNLLENRLNNNVIFMWLL